MAEASAMAEAPPQVHGACEVQLVRATKRVGGGPGLARAAASAAALVAGAVAVAVLVSIPQRPRTVAETGAALFSSLAPATHLRPPLTLLSDVCCEGHCRGAPPALVQGMQASAMAVRHNLSDAAVASTTCSSSEAAGRLCECLVVGVPGSRRSRPAAEVEAMSAVHRRAHVISGLYQGGHCSLSQCLAASDALLATLCLPCAPGYLQVPGDIGEKHLPVVTVKSCTDCATLCDGIAGCVAYSCSKTEMQCRLDSKTVPGNNDLAVCSKEASLTLPQPAGRRLLGECDCSKCVRASLQDLQGHPPGFAGARVHQAQEKREESEAREERKEREIRENEDKLRHALEQREERNEREEREERREEREARAAARLHQSAKTLEKERKVREKQKPQREADAIAHEAADMEAKARKAISAAGATKERKNMLRMQGEVLRNSKEWNQEISDEIYAMGAHSAPAYPPSDRAVQNRPLSLSETGCVDELNWVDPLSGAKCSDWKGYGCEDSWEGYSKSEVVKKHCPKTCNACGLLRKHRAPPPAPDSVSVSAPPTCHAEACLENGKKDGDCCGFAHETGCAEGFTKSVATAQVCYEDKDGPRLSTCCMSVSQPPVHLVGDSAAVSAPEPVPAGNTTDSIAPADAASSSAPESATSHSVPPDSTHTPSVAPASSPPAQDGITPVLKMKIGLPLGMADFTDAVQDNVRGAIAAAAGVDPSMVRILSVVEGRARRRLLAGSIALEIAIDVPPDSPGGTRWPRITVGGHESIIGTLTADNLNRKLAARDLPQAQILEPPIIVYEQAPAPSPAPDSAPVSAEAPASSPPGVEPPSGPQPAELMLNMYCRQYLDEPKESSKRQKKLDKCRPQDCQQAKEEVGCHYMNPNGFCWIDSGQHWCAENKGSAWCLTEVLNPTYEKCEGQGVVANWEAAEASPSAPDSASVSASGPSTVPAEDTTGPSAPADAASSAATDSATSHSVPAHTTTNSGHTSSHNVPAHTNKGQTDTNKGHALNRYVDIKTGQVFYGPAKGGQRVYKNPWENRYDDPFGFKTSAIIQTKRTEQEWDHFDDFIKTQKAGGALEANAKADDTVRSLKQGLQRPWMGNLSPLMYRENHWFKQKKWQGDTHNGEEQAGRVYHYRKPPPAIPSGLFPEPESVTPIITGSVPLLH